jgi:hypothetical protein
VPSSAGFRGDLHSRCVVGNVDFRARELGQTEVENFCPPVVRDEQVFRLQVAVNNSLFVRGRQPTRDLLRVVDSLARGRQRTIAQAVAQRFAFEQLGNDIRCAVGLANVVNR